MRDFSEMLTRIKSEYLDVRGVGIRRFATMTTIRRSRLNQIFAGQKEATVSELVQLNTALNIIETHHQAKQAANRPLVTVGQPKPTKLIPPFVRQE